MSEILFDEEELEEFRQEASELLEHSETILMELEKGGNFLASYDSLFRNFHSLKGGAGMMGMDALQKHMHGLENYLSECKKREALTPPEVTFFLEGADAALKLLQGEEVFFDTTQPSSPEPTHQAQSKEAKTTAKKSGTSKYGLVYAVDDEPDIADYVQEVLNEYGFEVEAFTDPTALLEAFQKKKPDLIVTDMKMPQMTGMDLLRKVRLTDTHIPIIFLSAFLTKEVLIEAIDQGVESAIEKPIEEEVLLAYALNAIRRYQVFKLLNKTVDILMYQYSDLDQFLREHNREEIRVSLKSEITELLKKRRELKQLSFSKTRKGTPS